MFGNLKKTLHNRKMNRMIESAMAYSAYLTTCKEQAEGNLKPMYAMLLAHNNLTVSMMLADRKFNDIASASEEAAAKFAKGAARLMEDFEEDLTRYTIYGGAMPEDEEDANDEK